jgi:hypothetical protein
MINEKAAKLASKANAALPSPRHRDYLRLAIFAVALSAVAYAMVHARENQQRLR